ncbi:phage holin family protein [Patescibacteria group bacterium]|nr:phage holin family protein [Patescibacteria group bacterium]
MKAITRAAVIYSLTLYFLPMLIPGLKITGGFLTFLMGGIALALMFLILKPILNIISFPINLVTLGLFSILTNAFILYLLVLFVSGISIVPFNYPPSEVLSFAVPKISFPLFFAYIYTAFMLSFIDSFLSWLIK